jgi:hypothetical protein
VCEVERVESNIRNRHHHICNTRARALRPMTAQRRLEKTDEPENKRRSIFSSTCMMFCTLQTMGTSSYSTGTHLRNVDTKIAIDSQSVHSLLNRQPRAIHSNNTQRTKLPLTMKLGLTIVALLAGRSAAFTRSAFHSKGNVALYENKVSLSYRRRDDNQKIPT